MSAASAILLDSFRHLQAKKLFWFSTGVSLLIAVLFASIGFTDSGISLLFGAKVVENPFLSANRPEAGAFYILLFTDLIVKFWLAFFALMLALISTVSIFPDMIAEGSIGISLSKPVSRLRLFLWKWFGGLLFVTVQVSLFTLVVFLAFRWRLGDWNFSIWWAVPMVVLVFALLYSFAVLVGVWTRSTLFSLLATLGLWGCCLIGQWAEDLSYQFAYLNPMEVDWSSENAPEEIEENSQAVSIHSSIRWLIAPLPKTRLITQSIKQKIRFEDRPNLLQGVTLDMLMMGISDGSRLSKAVEKVQTRHSDGYVYGTSIGFALVCLVCSGWIFWRRDF